MARKPVAPRSVDIEPRSWDWWRHDLDGRMEGRQYDPHLARVLWGLGLSHREAAYDLSAKAIAAQLAKERAERFVADVMTARGWKPTVKAGVWVGS